MRGIYLIFAFALHCFLFAFSSAQRRIVGGEPTPIRKQRWHVAVLRLFSFECSGSIIADDLVLTAASCVYKYDATSFHVRYGTNAWAKCGSGGTVDVAEYYKYDTYPTKYSPANLDVAILRLATPLTFTPKVGPIKLFYTQHKDGLDSLAGKNVTISGWGYDETGLQTSYLLTANMTIVAGIPCFFKYEELSLGNELLSASVLCAKASGKGACYYDYGSPVVLNNRFQVAIASFFTRSCADPLFPDAYSKVQNFKLFIDHFSLNKVQWVTEATMGDS